MTKTCANVIADTVRALGVTHIHAWEGILAGHSQRALVSCGVNWTAHMDYTQGHSICIGDGAGVAVVGINAPWCFVDYATETRGSLYGAMTMKTWTLAHDVEQINAVYRIEPTSGI